jgi:hypothetical protein
MIATCPFDSAVRVGGDWDVRAGCSKDAAETARPRGLWLSRHQDFAAPQSQEIAVVQNKLSFRSARGHRKTCLAQAA